MGNEWPMSTTPEPRRAVVPGSERPAPAGAAAALSDEDLAARATVTVVVRPRTATRDEADALARQPLAQRTYVDRAAFADRYGADPSDIAAIETFALAHDLVVLEASVARRSIVLEGTLAALVAAFETSLFWATGPAASDATGSAADDATYRGRSGTVTVPLDLAGIVVGVFGLDDRAQARAHIRRAVVAPRAAGTAGMSPLDVAKAYAFPAGDGKGQTIALIELGGGYVQADIDAYFSSLGVAAPSVTSVSVDGGANAPVGDPNSADGEVMLDIEVAGAIAPAAKIVVYFAPNTDQGFLDAVTTAIHDTTNAPTIVSISWGGPESTWTQQAATNFDTAFSDAATLGVSVLVAAGDGGSTDGLTDGAAHVDFPASSSHATACGGTRLVVTSSGTATDTVWNDLPNGGATGGGVSDLFPLPTFQNGVGVPPSVNSGNRIGRGVPDVSGNADPQTGYVTRVDGRQIVVGGTSAVAPLWAGLVARLNANLGKPLGALNPTLYGTPGSFFDVVSGTNGGYSAKAGWDACTGLGRPIGTTLATALGTPAKP